MKQAQKEKQVREGGGKMRAGDGRREDANKNMREGTGISIG